MPYGTPAAGNFAVPPAPARRGRGGGGGAIIAILTVFGLLAAGGIVFALTRGQASTPGNDNPSSSGGAPIADVSDGGDDANGQATTNDHPRKQHLPPLIDTALPSLPAAVDPGRASGRGADGGANVTPSVPPTPANDPHACKSARVWQSKIAQASNPSPKMLRSFNTERAKCIKEGGHL
jgi:hypothetical protein